MLPASTYRPRGSLSKTRRLAACVTRHDPSPPVMRKRLVGVGHPVSVVLFLDRVAPIAGGVQNLARKAVSHSLLAASSRIRNQPANCEAVPASFWVDFNRHLIRRAAYPARLHLNPRFHVINCFLKRLQRVFLSLVMDLA